MLMLLVSNSLLSLTMWAALHWIGLDNPGAWAVAAGLLHVIPYFGSLIAAVAIGLAAFPQFASFTSMFRTRVVTRGIATFVSMLVATWMTGRNDKLIDLEAFGAVLFGGVVW